MSDSAVALLGRSELSGSLRARWFPAYACIFLLAGAVLAFLGSGQVLVEGYRSSLRATAGLMHLVILFVPVMALIPAVGSLADDRESGILEYLLAQPLSPGQVFAGKWLGTAAAMALAVVVGLAPGGAAAIVRGVPVNVVLLLLGLTLLLALTFVSVGFGLSAITGVRARATAVGVAVWLVLVVLGSLGIMAASVRWGVPRGLLLGWSFANPVEAFRMAMLVTLDPDAGLLGPVGVSLLEGVGVTGIVGIAAASLLAWTLVPGLLGLRLFRTQPAR